MTRPLFTIVGAGTGIGLATARRFGAEGYDVALIARSEDKLRNLCEILDSDGIDARYHVADVRNAVSLDAAITSAVQPSNGTDVLLYNAANMKWKPLLDETAESITDDFQINVAGALTAVRAVLPRMRARRRGTILLTGSMFDLSPMPDFGSLSIGKAALRNFAQSLDNSLIDKGIRVIYLSISGRVSDDDPDRHPAAIADAYWYAHHSAAVEHIVNI